MKQSKWAAWLVFGLVAWTLVASIGCTTYVHRRPSTGTNGVARYEETKIRVIFGKLDASALRSSVQESTTPTGSMYSRDARADDVKSSGDAEAIRAVGEVFERGVKAGIEGFKASQGVP